MRILFVDDEPQILQGLRRMLFDLDDDWDARFACSATEALAVLAEAPSDVVVSDMRMPGMDGATLLEQVQSAYPDTVRIILSGQTDRESAVRAMRVAHHFLSKPFDGQSFPVLIERTLALTGLLRSRVVMENLSEAVLGWGVSQRLRRIVDSPVDAECAHERILRSVAEDAELRTRLHGALTALVSPAGCGSQSTLEETISRAGPSLTEGALLGLSLYDPRGPAGLALGASLSQAETQAFRLAKGAKVLSEGTHLADDGFVMGLLANIGQIALGVAHGAQWARDCLGTVNDGDSLESVETERFGASHSQVGAALLEGWGVPFRFVEAVANHHHPERALPGALRGSSLVAVAAMSVAQRPVDSHLVTATGLERKFREVQPVQVPGES